MLALSIALLSVFGLGSGYYAQLENHVVMDANDTFHLYWTVLRQTVIFELVVKTLGYVGFGISPDGGRLYSDVVLTYVNGSTIFLEDQFVPGDGAPVKDKIQNYELLRAYENETHTVSRFSRLINTGDSEQDRVIDEGLLYLLYAFSPIDPVKGQPVPGHGPHNRGSKQVTLIPSRKYN